LRVVSPDNVTSSTQTVTLREVFNASLIDIVKPNNATVGSSYSVGMEARNTGNAIGTYTYVVKVQRSGTTVRTFERQVELGISQSKTETFSWTPTQSGTYNIIAEVWDFNKTGLFDSGTSSNFTIDEVFEITSASLSVSKSVVDPGESYTLSGTVNGTGQGTVSVIYEERRPGGDWSGIDTKQVNFSGSSINIPSFTLSRGGGFPAGDYQYRLRVVSPDNVTSSTQTVTLREVFNASLIDIVKPNNATVGSSYSVGMEARNTGNAIGTYTYVVKVQRSGTTVRTFERQVELGISQSKTETFSWTPTQSGTYNIIAEVLGF
jgi:hypothetical protein